MNMQLVLATTDHRINGHSDPVARQLTARPFLNEAAGFPCCLPIIWRIFSQQLRAFDTGNGPSRDNDNMGRARRRPENGKASIGTIGYVDFDAGKPDADYLIGGHTDVVNYDP